MIDVCGLGYEYGRKQGVGGGRSCFSMGQWKELELQALIFRHIINGAAIPPQLIHLLITNKSFILSSPSPPYYQYPPACKFPLATYCQFLSLDEPDPALSGIYWVLGTFGFVYYVRHKFSW